MFAITSECIKLWIVCALIFCLFPCQLFGSKHDILLPGFVEGWPVQVPVNSSLTCCLWERVLDIDPRFISRVIPGTVTWKEEVMNLHVVVCLPEMWRALCKSVQSCRALCTELQSTVQSCRAVLCACTNKYCVWAIHGQFNFILQPNYTRLCREWLGNEGMFYCKFVCLICAKQVWVYVYWT